MNNPYLISFALINLSNVRNLPIGGKSLKSTFEAEAFPYEIAEKVTLELLLRIVAKTEICTLKLSDKEKSIITSVVPMDALQESIPVMKSEWIKTGDSELFMQNLKKETSIVYSITFEKYKGIIYTKI